jgi:hypothetical protein
MKTMGKTSTKKTSKGPREVINKAPREANGKKVIRETTKNRETSASLGEITTTSQVRGIVHRTIISVTLVLPKASREAISKEVIRKTTTLGEMTTKPQVRGIVHRTILSVTLVLPNALALAEFNQPVLSATPQR